MASLKVVSCVSIVYSLLAFASAGLFDENHYITKDPRVAAWWSVMPADVSILKADAATLNSTLTPPADFANTFVAAVGRGQGPQAARALAYIINGNMTYGGGCPAPRTQLANAKITAALLETLKLANNATALLSGGRGIPMEAVSDVDAANIVDGGVQDAILGALFMATRPCGPPNRLSSGTAEAVEEKYLNSTCYYVGPILTALMQAGSFESSFATASKEAAITDNWVAGSIFRAFDRCYNGGVAAQVPPSWLNRSFPASTLQAARVAQPSAATTQGLLAAGGRRLLA
eukprot:jgi/Botrbrau1/18983/Bobra.0100s0020.1